MSIVLAMPTVTDRDVERAVARLRRHYGTLVPVQGRGITEGDAVQATVHGYVDDAEIVDQDDYQFYAVNDASLFGFDLTGLADALAGAEPCTERWWAVEIPATHANPSLRGKVLNLHFVIQDVRHLIPAELAGPLFDLVGVTDEADLRSVIREELLTHAEAPAANA